MTIARPFPPPSGAGYFPKVTASAPAWLETTLVDEICSVSECISAGPPDWIRKWLHNDLGFFDTAAAAWEAVAGDRTAFDVYAYAAYPFEFDRGVARPWVVPVAVDLDLLGFDALGLDIVSRSSGSHCECSPLSCNRAAGEFPVNRFCLMPDLPGAYDAAIDISRGHYEPGPFYVFAVYRRPRPRWGTHARGPQP